MENHLDLPEELEAIREEITKTLKPYIKLTGSKQETKFYQSKFAGVPYFPKTMEYPMDENHKPMRLLAQLNFKDIPKLEAFPEKGILQFFISDQDVLGMDFNQLANQENFKVIYHPEVVTEERLITDFSFLDEFNLEFFPIEDELGLTFTKQIEPVSDSDFRFDEIAELLGEQEEFDEEDLWEAYSETFLGDGSKIGGYPYFTQTDPRDYQEEYQDHDVLLLQIDSDDENGIMWGDSGVANFFVKREDLIKLDFSNVIYNWDCH